MKTLITNLYAIFSLGTQWYFQKASLTFKKPKSLFAMSEDTCICKQVTIRTKMVDLCWQLSLSFGNPKISIIEEIAFA